MKLTRLISAESYRDGGSYGASFETDDGLAYNVWLQQSKMPDDEGLHHRWLFQNFGKMRPEGCLPVVTGSEDERVLLEHLHDFLASATQETASPLVSVEDDGHVVRLKELVGYIERREPCFPFDLARRQSS